MLTDIPASITGYSKYNNPSQEQSCRMHRVENEAL